MNSRQDSWLFSYILTLDLCPFAEDMAARALRSPGNVVIIWMNPRQATQHPILTSLFNVKLTICASFFFLWIISVSFISLTFLPHHIAILSISESSSTSKGLDAFPQWSAQQGSQQIHLNSMPFNAQPRPFPGSTEHPCPLRIFSTLSNSGKQTDVQFIHPKNLVKRGILIEFQSSYFVSWKCVAACGWPLEWGVHVWMGLRFTCCRWVQPIPVWYTELSKQIQPWLFFLNHWQYIKSLYFSC